MKFINKIPFIMTMSHKIQCNSAELIKDMKANTIMTSLLQLKCTYQGRVFIISSSLEDGKFKHI